MELFFPLIGVFALAVAAIAATACILVPGPKHLVSKVFFGTISFIFGGALCTTIATVLVTIALDSAPSHAHVAGTVAMTSMGIGFAAFGSLSAWATVKLVDGLYKAMERKRNDPPKSGIVIVTQITENARGEEANH